ncbi:MULTISPECIES: ABC transporter permease [Micrococcales]|uniref:Lantibiotic ABC transporter permease n=1 Tax=Brevibacterium aurantiacum TaxID=273384 RepID=A0A2A3YPL0_BREAU|nr:MULTISPECIES: ABC transporter permease [Micrococcales]PCC41218.1 lantibiotic ABC transporter permease [Brevibacterium aurantiacum]RCS75622.1 lantibiotic ABC transporter permease [Brachybacterium alimentarium]TGD36717.1 lantibiotic ABC transporter permease [Brevibacterium aurantiacum]
MNAKAVTNEFAKMRHRQIGLIIALLAVSASALTAYTSLGSGLLDRLDDPDGFGWKVMFGGLGMGVSLVAPILLAVLASRQVEIEHTGNGWLSSSTAGLTPGQMCRAKFIALGGLVILATIAWGAALIGFGAAIGIESPIPGGRWTAYIGALIVINLAVLAFHILLSAKIENQLVCVGVGIAGILIAMFSQILPDWISHLTPWGYYALTIQSAYVGTEPVYFDLPYFSVLGLAVVGGGLFLAITGRFDRQEA